MVRLADGFWNFRGKFKIAKVVDVGTQMSLVRKRDGRFLLIDSYAVEGDDRRELLRLTDNGAAIDDILNVHPFHTLHCHAAHQLAPSARLFGTRRHWEKMPDLPWSQGAIEDEATQAKFADDLAFSVPKGTDLVTADDSVHAASVLVRHRDSGIVHVDDTFNVLAAPGPLRKLFPQSRLKFHPMLPKALQKRSGAADDYAQWARDLAVDWAGTPIVCAAHSTIRRLPQDGWRDEVLRALSEIEKTLSKHRSQYG
jgi:hypothetical protein